MDTIGNDEEPEGHGAGSEETYEVGYRKPPEHGKFKKHNKFGKGRPKGAKNLKSLVTQVLDEKVPAKINGKVKKVTKSELAIRQLANKAIAGDLKAIAKLLELLALYEPQEDIVEVSPEQAAYDLETILHHLRMNGLLDDQERGDDHE